MFLEVDMLAMLLGLVFFVAGGLGVLVWHADFLAVIKGLVPFLFMVGGLISIVAGATNIAESFGPKMGDESVPEEKKEK